MDPARSPVGRGPRAHAEPVAQADMGSPGERGLTSQHAARPSTHRDHADVFCDNNDSTIVVDIDLVDASTFLAGLGGGKGDLTVNIFDQFGAPIINTLAFVDAAFAPIIYDVCEDGDASATNDGNEAATDCGDNLGDFLVIGTLDDTSADGTWKITDMPTDPTSPNNQGKYFMEVCTENFFCNFTSFNITEDVNTTVNVSIFVPDF